MSPEVFGTTDSQVNNKKNEIILKVCLLFRKLQGYFVDLIYYIVRFYAQIKFGNFYTRIKTVQKVKETIMQLGLSENIF